MIHFVYLNFLVNFSGGSNCLLIFPTSFAFWFSLCLLLGFQWFFCHSASSYVSPCSLIPPIILELMLVFCSSHQRCLSLLAVQTDVWSCTENKSLFFCSCLFYLFQKWMLWNPPKFNRALKFNSTIAFYDIEQSCFFSFIEVGVINGNLKPQDLVSMGQGNIM